MGVDADFMMKLRASWEAPARAFEPYGDTAQMLLVALIREKATEVREDLTMQRDDLLGDSLAGVSAFVELLAQVRGIDLDKERRAWLADREDQQRRHEARLLAKGGG